MKSKREISGVIATFHDRKHAEYFVEQLQRAGFREDEYGVLGPPPKGANVEEDAVAGAITGGMLGAVAGVVATVLIPGVGPFIATGLLAGVLGGTVAGATAGGALGALIGLGVPEEKALHHERELMAGRTLVLVQAEGRGWEAMEILERCEGHTSDKVKVPVVRYKLWQETIDLLNKFRSPHPTRFLLSDSGKKLTC